MKTFTSIIAIFGLLTSLVSANAYDKRWDNGTSTTVTEVVTAYTTYCPEATTISINNVTYTVSSATTLTITNCPCTLTHTIPISSGVAAPTGGAGAPGAPGLPGSPSTITSTTSAPGSAGPTASGSSPAGNGVGVATGAAVAFGPKMGLMALGAVVAVLL